MKIKTRYTKDIAIIEIEGRININSSKLIEEVGSILDFGVQKIIIDMENVDFIDYNGLSVLAIAYKSALNQKGVMKLCGISLHILELLRVVKLDEVFDIYANVDETLASFIKRPHAAGAPVQPLRRRFTRLNIDTPVHFKLTGGLSRKAESNLFTGRVANISGSGIFIRTVNVFPPGCEVEMTIFFYKGRRPGVFKGVVLWLADKSLQPDFYPGMGVEFNRMPHHAQEDIILFIERNAGYKKETI